MIRRVLAAAWLAVAVVTASPAVATSQAAPTGTAPVMTLLDQAITVAPDGDFNAAVKIEGAPEGAQVVVDIYDAVAPGGDVGAEPEDGSAATFPPIDLAPSQGGVTTALFSISLYTDGQPNPDPAWGWPIDEPGVYPVRIDLRDADGNRLQVLMTSLIRLPEPDQQVTQTGAALLVGLHRPPPEDPDARAAADTADADLLSQLDPVFDVLDDHPALPATFSITPDTLARIGGDPDATAQLARLREELAADDRSVLDAPYVDVDAASLVHADLADNLTLQRDFGRQTISELLEEPVTGTWQLRNRVDDDTLAQLRTRGITRALVPSDAITDGAGVLAPVDLPSGGGTTRAVALSPDYVLGLDPTSDPVLAAHRLLARLAAAGPGPTGRAAVVVSVDPALVSGTSFGIVADALAVGSPFFAPTDVTSVLEAPPQTTGVATATPVQPQLGTYPIAYRSADDDLASYQSMVGGRQELTSSYELTLAVSAAQDLPLEQRLRDVGSVTSALQVPFTSITMPEKDKVTLGADDAKFPLPIDSSLDYPVKVVIELEGNDRVRFPDERIEKTLPPGSTVVKVRVQTRTAGDTPVRIEVRSPDDGVILAESHYTIRSTAVSGVGIVLTVGAALFLAVWWGRHWRRTRAARRAETTGDGDDAGTSTEPEAEQPQPV